MSIGLILGPLGGGFFSGIFGLDFVFKGGSLVVALGLIVFVLLMRRASANGSLEQILSTAASRGAGGLPADAGDVSVRK
jgi:hypothetical protein